MSLEAGRYKVLVGLSDDGYSIQQIEGTWIEFTREGTKAYLPDRLDVGIILNSMKTTLNRLV